MKDLKNLAVIMCLVLLAACGASTTQIPLNYTAKRGTIAQYKPLSEIGEVKDSRLHPGTDLGQTRNAYGMKSNILQLEKPASEILRDAFNTGLKSRGMLSSGAAPYVINIDIVRFDCNELVNPEAHINWKISVIEKASGKEIYSKDVVVDHVGSIFGFTMSKTSLLKTTVKDALQEAVNQLLDDPAFISNFK